MFKSHYKNNFACKVYIKKIGGVKPLGVRCPVGQHLVFIMTKFERWDEDLIYIQEMPLFLTEHAIDRMEQRNVYLSDIERVITEGKIIGSEKAVPVEDKLPVRILKGTISTGESLIISIAIGFDDARVITVFKEIGVINYPAAS